MGLGVYIGVWLWDQNYINKKQTTVVKEKKKTLKKKTTQLKSVQEMGFLKKKKVKNLKRTKKKRYRFFCRCFW
ncbi:hypothetical protein BBP11_11140 [Limosilactobacillus reuteri]|nr:hypothetical protein BBP11_11140 [Limosilactobacillus reuteri]